MPLAPWSPEGDFDINSPLLFIPEGGSSPEFSSGSVSGDQTSGQGFYFARCVSDSATHVALALGSTGGATSNSVCVALGALP